MSMEDADSCFFNLNLMATCRQATYTQWWLCAAFVDDDDDDAVIISWAEHLEPQPPQMEERQRNVVSGHRPQSSVHV